ncbi:adenine phosphoribosyltransferase [Prochlorococcus marinus str. MU1404]|uniref:adenine phosphoribosyltransferase n=1 Tax=Prochlorococcus marinus TaxID=1219 RepID=UPI001ADC827D|nr:adenine phosphoribosyltransferase [Prochlorococcus marinus]MBO8230371.1 adenine phosphoribosyltransferase [Prochlorococcus marinus XMU1404]MBW3072981.1 adenine phosphoribosyltransferase [Prochlorococcus marinus str. MU1404]MCR8545293.1 adenine phosphoribosyltransferase [Prochlorococcus marinus CUG1432]
MKKFEDLINTHKDFPKKGVDFKDVLGILHEPEVFYELITKMCSSQILKKSEAIISIDARGFIFGSAVSLKSSKPMIVARKPGKLPGEIVKQNYNLEYGENSLCIQKSSLDKYKTFTIIDDLLATGGTVGCVASLLSKNEKQIKGFLTVVELINLKGRSKLDFPIESLIKL